MYQHWHHRDPRRRKKGAENLFGEITGEKFSKLSKEIDIQVQKAERISKKMNLKSPKLRLINKNVNKES